MRLQPRAPLEAAPAEPGAVSDGSPRQRSGAPASHLQPVDQGPAFRLARKGLPHGRSRQSSEGPQRSAGPAQRVDGRDRPCVVNPFRAQRGPYLAAPRTGLNSPHLFQENHKSRDRRARSRRQGRQPRATGRNGATRLDGGEHGHAVGLTRDYQSSILPTDSAEDPGSHETGYTGQTGTGRRSRCPCRQPPAPGSLSARGESRGFGLAAARPNP